MVSSSEELYLNIEIENLIEKHEINIKNMTQKNNTYETKNNHLKKIILKIKKELKKNQKQVKKLRDEKNNINEKLQHQDEIVRCSVKERQRCPLRSEEDRAKSFEETHKPDNDFNEKVAQPVVSRKNICQPKKC